MVANVPNMLYTLKLNGMIRLPIPIRYTSSGFSPGKVPQKALDDRVLANRLLGKEVIQWVLQIENWTVLIVDKHSPSPLENRNSTPLKVSQTILNGALTVVHQGRQKEVVMEDASAECIRLYALSAALRQKCHSNPEKTGPCTVETATQPTKHPAPVDGK